MAKLLQQQCVFLCVYLLSVCETVHRVVVGEGRDAVLPCSLSTEENIVSKQFDWRKVGQRKKEVFMYNAGIHYNNGLKGQDEQFKGRVSYFPDQLKFGNASIKITQTKIEDSGNYICDFPRLQPRQTFLIELVIDLILKDRSGEIPGAGRPLVTIFDAAQTWLQLLCQVKAASPEPKMEWQDSTGNVLPAAEAQVSERGGIYDIILVTIVTKTDRYRCVVTQKEIGHQAAAETYVSIGDNLKNQPSMSGWLIAGMAIGAGALAVVLCCYKAHHYLQQKSSRGGRGRRVNLQMIEVKGSESVEEGETWSHHCSNGVAQKTNS